MLGQKKILNFAMNQNMHKKTKIAETPSFSASEKNIFLQIKESLPFMYNYEFTKNF